MTPQHLARHSIYRRDTRAGEFGIQPFAIAGVVHVIDRDIDGRTISGHAKVHAALNAAAPQFHFPQFVLACLPVECKHAAIFLTRNDHGFALANIHQQRAGGLVIVGAIFLRAVGVVGHHAGDVPGVPREGLSRPHALSGIERDSDHGVTVGISGGGVILACAENQQVFIDVDSGTGPHRRAGRAEHVCPHAGGTHRSGRVRYGVTVPDHTAVGGIDRHHVAAEGAAGIFRVGCCDHLER